MNTFLVHVVSDLPHLFLKSHVVKDLSRGTLKTFALVCDCVSEQPISPADEDVPSDLVNRKRRD